MTLADKLAVIIYQIATTKNKFKIILTPLGLIFWFSLGVLLVFISLWLDEFLPVQLSFPAPVNLFLSLLLLLMGGTLCLWSVYSFFKARGSPVPLNPPQKLITTGLYSQIRNPMLLGWIIMLFGVGILLNSISLILFLAPLFILLNILYVMTIEENFPTKSIQPIAKVEAQRRQFYRPIYSIHKSWARRPGSVFRAIGLAHFLDEPLFNENHPAKSQFYKNHSFN